MGVALFEKSIVMENIAIFYTTFVDIINVNGHFNFGKNVTRNILRRCEIDAKYLLNREVKNE
jgi:hypothetical protein